MRTAVVTVLALVLVGCAGVAVSTLPSMPAAANVSPSLEPSGEPSPIVGEWVGTQQCEWIVQDLTGFDRALVVDFIVGNGLIPGTTENATLMDAADLCADAVARQHSHYFTSTGRFGSRDFNGQQVDDAPYEVLDENTVEIAEKDFGYAIDGDELTLTAIVPEGCTSEDCAWQIMIAMNSQPLHRGRLPPP